MNKTYLILSFSALLIGFGNNAFAQFDDKLAVLETNLGTIIIEFFPNDAPKHVDNFIGLTESGFYDGVLFHRIIPGFMIQGGDPNTIDGDPNTWGIGGPSTSVDAEFNTIKHNRGIVSMARSADPNSGGSQFFIVHADSNFLDQQYTVFGRVVTAESLETLDKIALVETGTGDNPLDPEQVRLVKATIVNHSEISNLLDLEEPERVESVAIPPIGNQKFESIEHKISLSIPEGWMLQEGEKTAEDSPNFVAVGPKIGIMNPNISLTVQNTNGKTFDEIISEKIDMLKEIKESGNLKIISQDKVTINENDAFVTDAQGIFFSNSSDFNVQFREVIFYYNEKYYIIAYANGIDEFDSQLPKFEETIDSFQLLSEEEDVGGCLIATATFGSELAPQVQQLRELRDNTISSTKSGTAFMTGFNQFYYSFSPVIADLERENPLFKEAVKLSITPMLLTLSILNYAEINSEEEMLFYGTGIILMNIGMYFAAPIIIIYKIRK